MEKYDNGSNKIDKVHLWEFEKLGVERGEKEGGEKEEEKVASADGFGHKRNYTLYCRGVESRSNQKKSGGDGG